MTAMTKTLDHRHHEFTISLPGSLMSKLPKKLRSEIASLDAKTTTMVDLLAAGASEISPLTCDYQDLLLAADVATGTALSALQDAERLAGQKIELIGQVLDASAEITTEYEAEVEASKQGLAAAVAPFGLSPESGTGVGAVPSNRNTEMAARQFDFFLRTTPKIAGEIGVVEEIRDAVGRLRKEQHGARELRTEMEQRLRTFVDRQTHSPVAI